MEIDRERSDRFKGISIILIVIGHNYFVTKYNPFVFSFLYTFHVFLFFILVGLRPEKWTGYRKIADLFIRYYVPFFAFSLVYFALFTLVARKGDALTSVIHDAILAILIGSAQKLDISTGFQLLWFLPALFAVRILRMVYCACSQRALATIVVLLVHVSAGLIPSTTTAWIPFGLFPASFVLIFVLWAKEIAAFADRHTRAVFLVALAGLSVVGGLVFQLGMRVNVALGQVYGIDEPLLLLISDLSIVFGFLFVYIISSVQINSRWLISIGQASLIIFLTHQFVFQVLWKLMDRGGLLPDPEMTEIYPLMLAVPTVVISIGAGLLFRAILRRMPLLNRTLFPKGLTDWPPLKPFL